MKHSSTWFVLTLTLLAGACGGGGGGGSAGTGELRIEATDAPLDYSLVAEASVRVREIKVHRQAQGDSGFVTLYSGPGIDLNLLDLRNGVRTQLVNADIAPGEYRQVRLVIDQAHLELTNGNVYDSASGNLSLTSLPTSGLKVFVDPPIEVVSGLSTTLLLDFDLSKTFHPIPANDPLTASSYKLMPVIKATNLTETGEIRGLVLKDDGQGGQVGVASATVFVLPPGETDPANSVASTGSLADGRYAVIGLAPGTYDVLAREGALQGTVASQSVIVGNVTQVDVLIQ